MRAPGGWYSETIIVKGEPMLYDFHTHTFLSDGVLSPVELVRRAAVNGYTAIAVTDHVGLGDQERVLEILVRECEMATREMGILAIPGVELTHLPPGRIAEAARQARSLGARIVIVHGETIKEPVAPGTNQAALECPDVDILAHPGLLSEAEAKLAAERGVRLELTARAGHSLTNGHVARQAIAAGATLIVDSDAHEPGDLLTEDLARDIALGAGVGPESLVAILRANPEALINRPQAAQPWHPL
jgi:histidinol phosphatase-like PHP family hydrolase